MLRITDLHKMYITPSEEVQALRGIQIFVEQGQFFTLLGPSGCGKSTLLRCVAGLEQPDQGEIQIGEDVVFSSSQKLSVPAHQRGVGMVFQSYAIWPHLDVFHNVAMPLLHGKGKHSKQEVRRRVENALDMVQLGEYIHRPATMLSGGQQQRVALARALVYEPRALLLDEPLSNLDAQLRVEMRKELRRLVRQLHITTLYVTHDQSEALTFSDRIAVMYNGVILQEGTPTEIYGHPRTAFVAKFVGNSNLIEGHIVGRDGETGYYVVETGIGRLRGVTAQNLSQGTPVFISLRQEAVDLGMAHENGTTNIVRARIEDITFAGDSIECQLRAGTEVLDARCSGFRGINFNVGQELAIHLFEERCIIVPRE